MENSKDKDMRLEAIVDYGMDEIESRAYKLCLIWLDKSRTMFPNYAHAKMSSKGDPRKSQIFKYCYKLARETQNNILPEQDYPLYVRAQLEILRHITDGKTHALISPNCLVGDKAWVRWKLWKKKFDTRAKANTLKSTIPANQIKVVEALDRTKEFLVKTFGVPTEETFQQSVTNKNFMRWVNLGKISPYYLALSPWVAKADLKFTFDLEIYKQAVGPEAMEYFQSIFPQESYNGPGTIHPTDKK